MATKNKIYGIRERKMITDIINNITIYDCILQIGKIIIKNEKSVIKNGDYTINQNGFHIIASKLSDKTFEEIEQYIKNELKDHQMKIEKRKLKSYQSSVFNNLSDDKRNTPTSNDFRLSSKEKKFIKKVQYAADTENTDTETPNKIIRTQSHSK
jgi:hypothetical protein